MTRPPFARIPAATALLLATIGGVAAGVLAARDQVYYEKSKFPILRAALDDHPRYIWRHSARNFGLKGQFLNVDGFRDALGVDERLRGPRRTRIVVLGSTGGFGAAVNYPETIAPLLERELARRGVSADVFNLSQGHYSSAQARLLFEDWAGRLKPDLVITLLGYVEGTDSFGADDRTLMAPQPWGAGWLRALETLLPGYEIPRRVTVAQHVENLRAIAETARAYGGVTLVVGTLHASPTAELIYRPYEDAQASAFPRGSDPEYLPIRMPPQKAAREGMFVLDHGFSAAGVRCVADTLLPRATEMLRAARRP